jgi:hypothetical protein
MDLYAYKGLCDEIADARKPSSRVFQHVRYT